MFYGRCKNGEYVTTSLLYLFYYYFLILLFKNVRSCNIWQDFFRSESFHELLCAVVFFSNGFEINLLCSQLSLNKHLFKTDNPLVLAPVIVQSFDCNYALYKTETSQRRTTDTLATINGQLRSALGSEKYRKCRCTTWQYKLQLG